MIPSPVPVSAPARLRERLRGAPDGEVAVVHRGRHAVYVDLDGWCLGVVGRAAAQVPCALRLGTDDLGPLAGAGAAVLDGTLHLDGTPLTIGRLVDARVPRLDAANRLRRTTVTAGLPPEIGDLVAPVPGRPAPLDAAGVARLVGRGDGLTPLGDDVLCGWLALHRAVGRATPEVDAAVRSLSSRTTLLSATLLECALHGEVLPPFAAYVAAIGTPDEPDRAAALAAVGHTSGTGLLHGALLALAELDHTNGVAA